MVNLERSTITISISETYRPHLKSLAGYVNQTRSFSGVLGQAALEYTMNHKLGEVSLDDFTNKNVVSLPQHYADDKAWRNYLNKQSLTELTKFWRQHMRVGGLLNKALEKHKDE